MSKRKRTVVIFSGLVATMAAIGILLSVTRVPANPRPPYV